MVIHLTARCFWCGAGELECPGAEGWACTMQGPPNPKVGLQAILGRHRPLPKPPPACPVTLAACTICPDGCQRIAVGS